MQAGSTEHLSGVLQITMIMRPSTQVVVMEIFSTELVHPTTTGDKIFFRLKADVVL